MSSPTARTLEWLRQQGAMAGVVERHSTFSGKKNDLFGFLDIVSVTDTETVGVQATSGSNVSARLKKIAELDEAKAWLRCPQRKLLVVGWKKFAKPIDRKYWRPIVREVTLADLGG